MEKLELVLMLITCYLVAFFQGHFGSTFWIEEGAIRGIVR